jgi:hypothetical protein
MGKRTKQAGSERPRVADVVVLDTTIMRPGEPHPNWLRFAKIHKGNPILDSETIYALPRKLIGAILAQIPDFFSPKERKFELDLARLSGLGFFLR